jgi:Zn-dependent protease
MILYFLNDLQDNPAAILSLIGAYLVVLFTGLAFHEFSHAWSAYQLGDDLAARNGRLTLNPIKHLDPLGSILILFVGFGWAKPTPVNTARLRFGPVRGGALVSFAGPASNFFFAALAALPLKAGWIDTVGTFNQIGDANGEEIVGLFLVFIVFLNVILGCFNLIPIPPLDGFDVIQPIFPAAIRRELQVLRNWGPAAIMILFVVSIASGGRINPLGEVVDAMSSFVFRLIN